jgi:ribonuclease P protein subunit POP4
MNEKALAKDELIGLHVRIKECKDSKWTGKSGVIIDETKNTFLIRVDNENKRIAKKIAKFEFEHGEKKTILNGSKIAYRSEDRIKKQGE